MKNTANKYNIKVKPCTSPRTQEAVKNQYIIEYNNIIVFQSYNSVIAIYDKNKNNLTLGVDWDYSTTTLKYFNQFLNNECYNFYYDLPKKRTLKDTINNAIKIGKIKYDENLI